jgi:hypothetical protein
MKPYTCCAVGAYPPNRVTIWRQSRDALLAIPAVDVFQFSQGLYDELVIAFDDDDQQALAESWSRADHWKQPPGGE